MDQALAHPFLAAAQAKCWPALSSRPPSTHEPLEDMYSLGPQEVRARLIREVKRFKRGAKAAVL